MKIIENKVRRRFESVGRNVRFAIAKNSLYEQGNALTGSLTLQNFKPGVATCLSLFEFFAVLDTPGVLYLSHLKNCEK